MLRKIKVYGTLKKFLDWETGTFLADISNVAEVGRFLVANWPSVEKHMQDQHYKIFVGNYNIGEEELNYPIGQTEEIRIVPVAIGARGAARTFGKAVGGAVRSVGKTVKNVGRAVKSVVSSPVGKVVTGAALIGLGGITGGATIGLLGAGTVPVSTVLGGIGASLALGGVSQMLTPTPELPVIGSSLVSSVNDPAGIAALDPQSNYSFSGVQNVSRAGIPVSLIFGEIFTGSVIVSAGVDTVQVKGTA
tara:strand:- start:1068 stop:1811 length:744 start_codon:yes stop_codon:yes gene_type:complete